MLLLCPACQRRVVQAGARGAIGYVRLSSQEQAQHGLGLPVQEQAIVDWCRREGYELVSVCRDPGVPGTLPWHERGLAPRWRT